MKDAYGVDEIFFFNINVVPCVLFTVHTSKPHSEIKIIKFSYELIYSVCQLCT